MAEAPQRDAFMAWVWDPDAIERSRGFATAQLFVYEHELQVRPTRIGAKLHAAPEIIRYAWPAVVIEHHKPIPEHGVLVEINGKLGRVAVRGAGRGRLRSVLQAAHFEVIDVTHTGWEAPRPATREELGSAIDRVPRCVVES